MHANVRVIFLLLFLNSGIATGKIPDIQQLSDSAKISHLLQSARSSESIDSAFYFTRLATDIARKQALPMQESRSLVRLGQLFLKVSEEDSAKIVFNRAVEIHENSSEHQARGETYLDIGYLLMDAGRNRDALFYAHRGSEFYVQSADSAGLSRSYSLLGNIYQHMSVYETSLEYFFKSLVLKESLNDQLGISIILSSIGNTYLLSNKHREAIEYFEQSLEIDRRNNDREGIMIGLLNVGVVNERDGDLDLAIENYEEALIMARSLDYPMDEAVLLGNLGSTLLSKEAYNEALVYLFQSLEIKKSVAGKGSIAHTYNNISKTYLAMNHYDSAGKYASLAVTYAEESDLKRLAHAYEILASSDYKRGNFRGAYDHASKSQQLEDSIFSIESENRINELALQYQTEKKEEEIRNLTLQNEAVMFKRNVYIVAGLVISSFLLLLYFLQRKANRKQKLLLIKEQNLEKQKSQFFANISHEFRTPLTLILGPVKDLAEAMPDPDSTRRLSMIERNARRLLSLINQLLDLSKIDSDKLTLQCAQYDLITVIKGVSYSFHSIFEQKNIGFSLTSNEESLLMNFDLEQIETIQTNLLGNAMRFTPEGGRISVDIHVNDNQAAISITDNGSGIDSAALPHIFERFYQNPNNPAASSAGSGIGLALTKELVELHHGEIAIDSETGKGTTVTYQIPCDLESTVDSRAHVDTSRIETGYLPHASVETTVGDNQGKPIILVIEDHNEVFLYVQDILKHGYDIMHASDGNEGIQMAGDIIPDLIISDVMMPEKDGFEVCKILKSDTLTSHIPIILLTAKSDIQDKLDGLSHQADDYVTKPFVPKELLLRVENLINARKLLREKYEAKGTMSPALITTNSIDQDFLERVVRSVEAHIGDEHYGVNELGEDVGLGRSQLHRKLSALLGDGPNAFIRTYRLKYAHNLLENRSGTASEIAFKTGFSSHSYFTKCFQEQYGYAPSELLKRSV